MTQLSQAQPTRTTAQLSCAGLFPGHSRATNHHALTDRWRFPAPRRLIATPPSPARRLPPPFHYCAVFAAACSASLPRCPSPASSPREGWADVRTQEGVVLRARSLELTGDLYDGSVQPDFATVVVGAVKGSARISS